MPELHEFFPWQRKVLEGGRHELADGLEERWEPHSIVYSYARGDLALQCDIRVGSGLLHIDTRNLGVYVKRAGVHDSHTRTMQCRVSATSCQESSGLSQTG
jgi:hypothetical protein